MLHNELQCVAVRGAVCVSVCVAQKLGHVGWLPLVGFIGSLYRILSLL